MTNDISVSDVHRFFDDKVAGVRASTSGASLPSYRSALSGCSWFQFQPLSVEDVIVAVRQLPDKHCISDSVSTSLLKENIHVLALFLTFLFNQSLSVGSVPVIFKAAYITPCLKKSDLHTSDAKLYRPIFCLRCWSVWLLNSCCHILTNLNCCLACNRHTAHTTVQKQLYSRYFQTF